MATPAQNAAAIKTNAGYLRDVAAAAGPAIAARLAPYIDHIDAQASDILAQLTTNFVAVNAGDLAALPPAVAGEPIPGSTFPWAEIEAGQVPTAPPSIDTYGLMQQVAEIAGGYRTPDEGTPSQWATREGSMLPLREFVGEITGLGPGPGGAAYYPVSAYPLLPQWVMDAAGYAGQPDPRGVAHP